jgi:hypothetical protein
MIDRKARTILYVDPSGKTLNELDTDLNIKLQELNMGPARYGADPRRDITARHHPAATDL